MELDMEEAELRKTRERLARKETAGQNRVSKRVLGFRSDPSIKLKSLKTERTWIFAANKSLNEGKQLPQWSQLQ